MTKKKTNAELNREVADLREQLKSAIHENQHVSHKLTEARFAIDRLQHCDPELRADIAQEALKRTR